MLTKNQIKSIVESILLVSEDPINLDKLSEIIEESDKSEIKDAIDELKGEINDSDRGIRLTEVAGGFQFRTSPTNSSWIFRLNKLKPAKLSRAAIETLSIIAYRQPITKQEVEAIRGVDSGWTIKSLLERNLIKIIGKKEEPGNPLIYSTTKQFLEFFNLKSLDELPTLRDYHELNQDQGAEIREPELEFSDDKEKPEEIIQEKLEEKIEEKENEKIAASEIQTDEQIEKNLEETLEEKNVSMSDSESDTEEKVEDKPEDILEERQIDS